MKRVGRIGLLMGLALAVAACGDSVTEPQTPETVTFAASLGIDLSRMTKLPTGVYIQTITPGSGTPMAAGDRFTATYRGWLSTGAVFDEGVLTNFTLSRLIPGFAGIVGMTRGEVRKLAIPSELGYGPEDYGAIPGNSVLVFEVTLTQINP